VALEEDLVAGPAVVLAPEEVVEPDLVEARGRRIGRKMAADAGEIVVRAQDHRGGVPADEPPDPQLHGLVAGEERLLLRGDRVDVPGLGERWDADLELAGALQELVEDEPGSLGTAGVDEGVEGVHPLLRFGRVDVGQLVFELVEDFVDRFVLQRAPLGQWYGARRARLDGWRTIPGAADREADAAVAPVASARNRRARPRSRSRPGLRAVSLGGTGPRAAAPRRCRVHPTSCGRARRA